MVLEDIGSDPEADWKKSPEPMTQSSDSDAGLKSSISEAELSFDQTDENFAAKSKRKRYVKRSTKEHIGSLGYLVTNLVKNLVKNLVIH